MARKLGTITRLGVSLAVLGSAAAGSAAVPTYMTEQGRLFDAQGMPVTDATGKAIKFTIWKSATGVAIQDALWSEVQNVTTDNGYFSTQLGSMTNLPASLFDC